MTENDRWFMNALVRVRLPQAESAAHISIIEHVMLEGFNVPQHRHEEDETFYILEGRFRFQVAGETKELSAGEFLHVAGGVVHAFRLLSPMARFLTTTTGRFEDMVRAASVPAERLDLPPQRPFTEEDLVALVALCGEHGIEFVGPPIE